MFKPATREQVKLKLAIEGVSGSGKTYSSLLLAKGLGGKIAVIDTERRSARLYSNLVKFDVLELSPPFTPDKFIQAIKAAEQAKYDVLIIDSISHVWSGEGGILERVENAASSSRSGNSFQAWGKVGTPEYNRFISAILDPEMHIICTMRSKTAYEIVDNGNGKKAPKKIGLAPVQRDGAEYEFTIVFDLSLENNLATCSKNRTSLFKDEVAFKITEETGREILEWTSEGDIPIDKELELKNMAISAVEQSNDEDNLKVIYKNARLNINNADYLNEIVKACSIRKTIINKLIDEGNLNDHI